MILINSQNLNRTKELETASKNLPDDLVLQIHAEKNGSNNKFDMDFLFVPYKSEITATSNDVIFYNNKCADWVDFDFEMYLDLDDTVLLNLRKIPEKYNSIDLLIQNYNEDEEFINVCILKFLQYNELETLFSYKFEQTDNCSSVFCGTFARVSDGWKFYPRFKTYKDINEIIQQYDIQVLQDSY